jgi:hypothetical protein
MGLSCRPDEFSHRRSGRGTTHASDTIRRFLVFLLEAFWQSLSVSREVRGSRKPPRGGHRAAMRREALRSRLKLLALIVIGLPIVAFMIYINLKQ